MSAIKNYFPCSVNLKMGLYWEAQLAGSLGIYSGEEVSAISLGSLLQRSLSDTLGFRVIGFADFGIYSNNNIALIKLNQAQDLFANDNGIDVQLRLKVADRRNSN